MNQLSENSAFSLNNLNTKSFLHLKILSYTTIVRLAEYNKHEILPPRINLISSTKSRVTFITVYR